MLELLDIRFSFLCRSTHEDKDGKNPIILRVTYRQGRRDLFTGLHCYIKDWDGESDRVFKTDKEAANKNRNLEIILRKANDTFDSLKFKGDDFNIDELVQKLKGKDEEPELLIDYLEKGNKSMLKRVGVEITKTSYYKYRRSLQYMQEFLQTQFRVKNYLLRKIDVKFLEAYFYFLRKDKNISHNVACRYIQFVRTIINPAIRNRTIKVDPFRELKFRQKPIIREFLSQEEINTLIAFHSNDPDLERKRDIFLFACFTGLAYVDIKQFNSTHLEMDADGTWMVRKPRQKTGQESIIPLLPISERILIKNSPTGQIRDFKWYVSSNQKMNKGLKSLGEQAKISKTLHMHLARHTFATTVTLSNGIPIESVSKMLGHASIRQTQHYAKVVALKIKSDMERIKNIYI